MKKLYMATALLLYHFFLSAQTVITVSPGTDLYLPSATIFSCGGLAITPSSSFTLNGVSLTKATIVSHSTSNTYASRVYQFSASTSPFSGTIQFNYLDAELNGLSEASLRVNINNGSSWQAVNSTTNDATNNYVLTNAVAGKTLNEMALSDALATLPLQWGNVTAYRHEQTIKIDWATKQEFNVSHFTIERSDDGRNWNIVTDNIAATNTSSTKQYTATDNSYSPSRLYYRIKQTDMDGKESYSSIVVVAAENETNNLFVYPNPVTTNFYISNIPAAAIRRVQLYNNAGLLQKAWTTAQASYDMKDVPAGIYHLRIDLEDGSHQYFKISK